MVDVILTSYLYVCDTIDLPAKETPDFISPTSWPPYSPDLNLVDYKIRSVMQDTVHCTDIKIQDVNELRERIVGSWNHLHQSVIDSAIRCTRLQGSGLCSRKGGTL